MEKNKKRHKIVQSNTTCESCRTILIEQQCANDKCCLYSYTFKKVESIEIPEIDTILATVPEERKIEISKCVRELNEKEKLKGRSYNYWQMTAQEQWDEDKKLGILDWDGN